MNGPVGRNVGEFFASEPVGAELRQVAAPHPLARGDVVDDRVADDVRQRVGDGYPPCGPADDRGKLQLEVVLARAFGQHHVVVRAAHRGHDAGEDVRLTGRGSLVLQPADLGSDLLVATSVAGLAVRDGKVHHVGAVVCAALEDLPRLYRRQHLSASRSRASSPCCSARAASSGSYRVPALDQVPHRRLAQPRSLVDRVTRDPTTSPANSRSGRKVPSGVRPAWRAERANESCPEVSDSDARKHPGIGKSNLDMARHRADLYPASVRR